MTDNRCASSRGSMMACATAVLSLTIACSLTSLTSSNVRHVDEEFGFSFDHPKTWVVAASGDAARRNELARSVAVDPKEMERLQADQREVLSLSVPGAGAIAGRLTANVSSRSPVDCLEGYLVTLREGVKGMAPEVLERQTNFLIDGRPFERAHLLVRVADISVHQDLYAGDFHGKSLLFSVTTADEALLAELTAVVRSMKHSRPLPH